MISALAGFFAGTVHVLSGPDHLAAVAPLSAGGQGRAWRLGFRWGIGHAAGVLLVGIGALMARDIFPVQTVAAWSERLVGPMLILIALWGLRKAFSRNLHVHEHNHGNEAHVHFHFHRKPAEHATARAHDHNHAALGIGALHGMAGSSHFFGVTPALLAPNTLDSMLYLSCYALGTIASMTLFSSVIGACARSFSLQTTSAYRVLMTACAGFALVTGVYWMVSTF